MDMTQKLNVHVLEYLTREGGYVKLKRPDAPIFAHWNSVKDPYRLCGTHPDVVHRLWDEIGPALPTDCRGLVYEIPALVHAKSSVILALGLGTGYGLRLPGELKELAISAGAKTIAQWSTGRTTDIRLILGDEWVFGAWLPDELIWCKKAYEKLDIPSIQ
jgi:hypothetical protein